jgi:hypothetical protein
MFFEQPAGVEVVYRGLRFVSRSGGVGRRTSSGICRGAFVVTSPDDRESSNPEPLSEMNSLSQGDAGLRPAASRWVPVGLTLCLIVGAARTVAEPLLSHASWMMYEQDDFFYYLKVAQNIAHGHGSTFNGIVPTNGYHPLWLMVLTVLSVFTSRPGLIQLFLAATIFVATLATYFLARALIKLSGAHDLIVNPLAAYIAVYSIHIFTSGMEVVLTIPLVLAVLLVAQRTSFWQKGLWQSACLGLLVSAMLLSRLDTILLAGLMFLSVAARGPLRRSMGRREAAGVALGLVPVALYFVSNWIWFDGWLPVSAVAKQLKFNHLPSSPAFESLLGKRPETLISVVPIVLAILFLPVIYERLTKIQKALYPVVLIFPFFSVLLLSCLSDWQLWDWYFYTLRTALSVAFAMLLRWRIAARVLEGPLIGVLASVVMATVIFRTHEVSYSQAKPLQIAEDVRAFAAAHPGRYAMGDRAGLVAYLLPEPMVQTEGLMMDRKFLENIRRQLPLRGVLGEYGVRYYIGTSYEPHATACFQAVEPLQAGPESPHMTGEFCEAPVAVFEQEGARTLVYDLQAVPVRTNPYMRPFSFP